MENCADAERYDDSRHCVGCVTKDSVESENGIVEMQYRDFVESIGHSPENCRCWDSLDKINIYLGTERPVDILPLTDM